MKKLVALVLAALLVLSSVSALAEISEETKKALNLPISDEKITISFWWPQASDMGELSSPNDSEFLQYLEEITNVHVDWIVPASGTEETSFQLLFASDEMPDIVMEKNVFFYRNGEEAAVEEGYFVDLNNYKDCMPNYMAFLDANPEYQVQALTDSGMRPNIYQCFYRKCETEAGLVIRKDMLDKLGLDVPVTYDDWCTVLKAFKEQLGVYAPLYLMNNGATTYNEFSAGYGVGQSFFQVDGEVKFGPVMEGWKEYLQMMNKWYAEGLLDPDFMSRTGTFTSKDTELLYGDNIGAWVDWTTRCDNNYVSRGAQNPDFMALGVTPPVKTAGDTTHMRYYDLTTNHRYAFSATGKHIEEAIRWLDLFFNWEVAQDANYGMVDGRSFNYGEGGKRFINTEYRYNNPEGVSSTAFFLKYGMKDPALRIQDFQQDVFLPMQRQAMLNWTADTAKDDWNIPKNISMTAEESNAYNMVMGDITTYVNECAVQFITGVKSFDEWDAYVATIEAMGLEDAMQAEQAAVTRYFAR